MAVRMAPLDWRPVVGRCYRRLEPRALILVETEIWPALLGEAHRRALPVGVINGRISQRSFKRYKMLRGLLHPLLEKVRCVAARTQEDAQAFARLGVPREALQVTGNTKYSLPERPEKDPQWLRREDWTNVLVMGSLRSEELEAVRRAVEVVNDSQGESDRALIVLAPRHLDRAASFVDIPRRLRLPHARRSDIGTTLTPPGSGVFVLILDTLGELQDLWWMATAGFVGGTLAPLGGHNLYEPASRGCPTIFGPSVDTVTDVADALLQSAGGRVVPDGERLGQALVEFASLGGVREEASGRAMEAAARLSGGAVRSVDWLMSRGVLASP
jgi:3-deoxy-D-manno-octulosonic-acid transferase